MRTETIMIENVPDSGSEFAVFAPTLEGFEGPLDLLLSLVRESHFDLNTVSVAALAEQYITFLHSIPPEQLQRAAEYLLMASWLALLKSRLLLPPERQDNDEEDPILMAERLAVQMQKLAAMQKFAVALQQLPQLGRGFFVRGDVCDVERIEHVHFQADLSTLLRTMRLINERQAHQNARLQVAQLPVLSIEDARAFLANLMPQVQEWQPLDALLPDQSYSKVPIAADNMPIFHRSCLASTLMAALEMQREGELELRQEHLHASLQLRNRS